MTKTTMTMTMFFRHHYPTWSEVDANTEEAPKAFGALLQEEGFLGHRTEMVVSSSERIDAASVMGDERRSSTSAARRLQLLSIAAMACATLVAAPMLISAGREGSMAVALEQKAAAHATKGAVNVNNLLGGLEKVMDSSIDKHIMSAFKNPARVQQLSQIVAPFAAKDEQLMMQPYHPSVPVSAASGYHRLLPFDPHPYVTQTQLDRLVAEKRELSRKREAILRTLKMRRQAAAAKAAKDATELDKIRLERAVQAAKKRQLEGAEQAARAAAAMMRQAAIAKQQAMHAAAVAQARQRELEMMGAINHAHYVHDMNQDDVADAASDMQYQQDKSIVDAKLQGYLAQERDLLHKIAAVEQVARHGGRWPEGGMPKTTAMPTPNFMMSQEGAAPQLAQQPPAVMHEESDSAVRQGMIQSIQKAVEANEAAIKQGGEREEKLGGEMRAEDRRMQSLQETDARLEREIRQAQAQ